MYSQVAENEFFVDSEVLLDRLEELKIKQLEKFSEDSEKTLSGNINKNAFLYGDSMALQDIDGGNRKWVNKRKYIIIDPHRLYNPD